MREIVQSGLRPSVVRLYDVDKSRYLSGSHEGSGNILLLGFDGHPAVIEAEYDACVKICAAEGGVVSGANIAQRWMDRRFDFSMVEGLLNQEGGMAETIEIAHFWDRIEGTYHALKAELLGHAREVLCHFSHVYPQGTSLYMIILDRADSAAQAEERLLAIWEAAMRICQDRGRLHRAPPRRGLARTALHPQLAGLDLQPARGHQARPSTPGIF